MAFPPTGRGGVSFQSVRTDPWDRFTEKLGSLLPWGQVSGLSQDQ